LRRSSPCKTTRSARLRERRGLLADKLHAAEEAVKSAEDKRQDFLLTSDAADEKAAVAADGEVLNAQVALGGIADALEQLDVGIRDAEAA
jgi:hypothetical protein